MNAITLILSDARGVYIPRDFVTDQFGDIAQAHCAAWGIEPEDAEILAAGPDNEFYWDTWDDVLDYAEFTDENGNKYQLYQDGNLWGICHARMNMEERQNFGFDLDPPDGWILCTVGNHFVPALYYGDYSGLDDNEIEALESFVQLKGDEIGDTCDAGFDECEITGMRGDCAHVFIKERT